ncbi:putative uncharacterized protein (plasmid) [Simkania negevensis Z]|uniref:Plasmid pRiA4b Orf3-like domain-containing protein n=2 Tax=Simkania negevensis TaxID=83561 RepID=F8L2S1_SIMNZ|nr:putative uncharacterized protein [Simkania negevensis Z]
MGWEDYHLFSFEYGGRYFEFDGNVRFTDRLSSLKMKEGDELLYVYDFGDSWKHSVVLEALIPKNEKSFYPCCIDGKRACPPEDSGGVWLYREKLKILKNKKHPDHEDLIDWIGKDFNPEYFDLKEVNENIHSAFTCV